MYYLILKSFSKAGINAPAIKLDTIIVDHNGILAQVINPIK
ncbi:hypothetical protein RintRC_2622 [Richelia intracellularis]|nr:hypothetical protein RintRC_2622 [Richelia intracellularis]